MDRKARVMLFLILVTVSASGCTKKMFQPPPPDFLEWTAPGVSVVDVKKKLLECGMPEPTSQSAAYRNLDRNARMSISLCMVRAGFYDKTGYVLCREQRDRVLPICAPGAEIPVPSISRRLNSHYCKAKTNYEYCKKNARYPDACDKNDYENPAPECLP